MATERKKYPITTEIYDLFLESSAAKDCRDKAIDSIWGTKRAIQYGKIYVEKDRQAWGLVHELYPELRNKTLSFKYDSNEVEIYEETK